MELQRDTCVNPGPSKRIQLINTITPMKRSGNLDEASLQTLPARITATSALAAYMYVSAVNLGSGERFE